jgi:hypothetical protein
MGRWVIVVTLNNNMHYTLQLPCAADVSRSRLCFFPLEQVPWPRFDAAMGVHILKPWSWLTAEYREAIRTLMQVRCASKQLHTLQTPQDLVFRGKER